MPVFLYYWYCFRGFLLPLIPRVIWNFTNSQLLLSPIFLWQKWDIFHYQYCHRLTIFWLYLCEVIFLLLCYCVYLCKWVAPINPQLLLKSLHIWHMQFPGTRGTFFMSRISLQFNFLVKYTSQLCMDVSCSHLAI